MTKETETLKLVRDWIAERPADRPVSAGKMISIIDRVLAQPPLPVQPEQGSLEELRQMLQIEVDRLIAAQAQPPLPVQDWKTPLKEDAPLVKWAKGQTPPLPVQPEQDRNFCPRCGKRTADLTVIHTCTPPPVPRQWVDLTDTQIENIYNEAVKIHRGAAMPYGQVVFGRAVQAKLKEKNTT